MEEAEDKVKVTVPEHFEMDPSVMADLDICTANANIDSEVAVPRDEASSRSVSFGEHCYRSEKHKGVQNARINKSQLNENDDTSVTTDSDQHRRRFKSVPSIPPSLKEYFDMVKEEYCKKLKAKKKSRSKDQDGKPDYSSLKGVFFKKPAKQIAVTQKSSKGTTIPSGGTQHKSEENRCSEKEKTNSDEVKLAKNSKKDVLRGSLNGSSKKFDRVLDLNCFENELGSTQGENSKQSVSYLVSYFENLRRSNSKRKQIKTSKSRGEKKVLESTEEVSETKNVTINFSQSMTKKKNKHKKTEGSSSANGAAPSISTDESNAKFVIDDFTRCWINRNNSFPTFVCSDCITTVSPKTPKNRIKRSKFTAINWKSPICPSSNFGKKGNAKLQQSKCKKEMKKKWKRTKTTKIEHLEKQTRVLIQESGQSKKKEDSTDKTIMGMVTTVVIGLIAVVIAVAVIRS